ncbi:MAG: ATP-binding protein [Beijerinckiaceae bacterium]
MRGWLKTFKLDTLTNRTILLMLIGIGVVHLASLYAYQVALDREAAVASDTRLADRLLTIKRAVMRVAPAEREPVAHELSGGPIEAHWSRTEHAVAGGPGSTEWEGLRAKLVELAPELAASQIVIGANRKLESDPHLALISLQLPDESWINVSVFSRLTPPSSSHGTVLSTTLMALGVVGLSVLLVRWMTRPLQTFANAAQRLYKSADQARVPEDGPREVRELASAFNEMQARIKRLIDDRTQALAAVSHDLKTPLTRLRLKSEGLKDKALAVSIRGDLAEMEQMLDQTLAYLSGDKTDEAMRPLDLAALVQTLADEASDAGGEVSVSGVRKLTIDGRPLALRRALGNLIGNAIKYGDCARVAVAHTEGNATITIDDDGQGIPAGDIERAFQPFRRLEQSRNKETGGFGLGLTIARTIITGHGGTLTLVNRSERGLTATIVLPFKATPPLRAETL